MNTTTTRVLAAAATTALCLIGATTLPEAASADTFPCQYDASTPHSLVVLGGSQNHPGQAWTALYSRHGVPVSIRHGHLGHSRPNGLSIRHTPTGWTDTTVTVWVGVQRCETT